MVKSSTPPKASKASVLHGGEDVFACWCTVDVLLIHIEIQAQTMACTYVLKAMENSKASGF
jgi:hypothetical protein